MDKEVIRQAILELRGKTPQEAYEILYFKNLSQGEKCIIYTLGTFQPHILQDGELKDKILTYRRDILGHERGFLEENLEEVSFILEAYLSPQYRKFIKHMMISYSVNTSNIFPVEGMHVEECGICHKKLNQASRWQSLCEKNPEFGEQNRKEYLSLGTTNTKVPICTNCMIQLKSAYDLLEYLDPGFLYRRF